MIRPIHLLICDDVRFELRSKITLVGSYGQSINVQHFPAELRFGYRIELQIEKSGPMDLVFQVVGPTDVVLVQAQMHAEVTDTHERAIIPIPAMPLLAEKPGFYKVQLVVEGKTYVVGSFELRQELVEPAASD